MCEEIAAPWCAACGRNEGSASRLMSFKCVECPANKRKTQTFYVCDSHCQRKFWKVHKQNHELAALQRHAEVSDEMFEAISQVRCHVARRLLANGEHPDRLMGFENDGERDLVHPLALCLAISAESFARLFQAYGASPSEALLSAIVNGSLLASASGARVSSASIVSRLIAMGADVQCVHPELPSLNPLLAACARPCSASLIPLLIKSGADPNASVMEWSPLEFVVSHGNLEAASLLLDGGADTNVRGRRGNIVENIVATVVRAFCDGSTRHLDSDATRDAQARTAFRRSFLRLCLEKGSPKAVYTDPASDKYTWISCILQDAHAGEPIDMGRVSELVSTIWKPTTGDLHFMSRRGFVHLLLDGVKSWKLDITLPPPTGPAEESGLFTSVEFVLVDQYEKAVALLSRGALLPANFSGDSLAHIASNPQNVHSTAEVEVLKAHVEEARNSLGLRFQLFLPKEVLTSNIAVLEPSVLERIAANEPQCQTCTAEEIRIKVCEGIDRLYAINEADGAATRSGAEAVALVWYRLIKAFANLEAVMEEVMVALFQGVLAGATAYGVDEHACAVGAIHNVIGVLQGRVSLDDDSDICSSLYPEDIVSYRALVELSKSKLSKLEDLQAEVAARLAEALSRTEELQCLEEIYNVFVEEPEHYRWAVNELRGYFFRVFMREFAFMFDKAQEPNFDPDAGDVRQLNRATRSLLASIAAIADCFCSCIVNQPECISKLLGCVLNSGGASDGRAAESIVGVCDSAGIVV